MSGPDRADSAHAHTFDFYLDHADDEESIEWTNWIAATLTAAGYRIEVPAWDHRPGHNRIERANRALTNCRHTLGVVTAVYADRQAHVWTAAYQQTGQGKDRAFIPILVQDTELPAICNSVKPIVLWNADEDQAREMLVDGVCERGSRGPTDRIPGATTPTSPFPGSRGERLRSSGLPVTWAADIGRRRLRRRLLIGAGAGAGAALLSIGLATELIDVRSGPLRRARPDEVGFEGPGKPYRAPVASLFQAAYDRAGGKAALGIPSDKHVPSGYVHQWGLGLSQDFVDGPSGDARIMLLNDGCRDRQAIAMTGSYWRDYTNLYQVRAADEMGYPVRDPVPYGSTRLVLLEGGRRSPGAMVAAPEGRFIWLPNSVWLQYQQRGGPSGSLGRPRDADLGGDVWSFERGWLRSAPDGVGSPSQPGPPTLAPSTQFIDRADCPGR